jgi:hypothetical protein
MSENGVFLSRGELASLKQVASGMLHQPIPDAHAARLLELRLVYRLLGSLRMTAEGREYLRDHCDH